ncbi:hypothetical protein BH10PSE10_BH10PSE10_22950 [soil metagenome]
MSRCSFERRNYEFAQAGFTSMAIATISSKCCLRGSPAASAGHTLLFRLHEAHQTNVAVWIPGSLAKALAPRNDGECSGVTTPATFRDGDMNPRTSDRPYVQRVLFVRGASRGRSLSGTGCGACACVSQTHAREAGVTVRANYVALPSGLDEDRMKAVEIPPDQGSTSPSCPGRYGPLAQNRRNGAP